MRALWFSWVALGSLAAPPQGTSAQEAVPAVLVLRIADPEQAASFSLHGVTAEVQRLFAPLGVRVVLEGEDEGLSELPIQVVLLTRDRSRGGMNSDTMGAVQRAEGSNSAVWILLSNVHYALGGSKQRQAGVPMEMVARAVGRVLAHELVHLIAPELPHASSGLMSARVGRGLLLREDLKLDPFLGSLLRNRLATRLKRTPASS
jgi:hypothetical protein